MSYNMTPMQDVNASFEERVDDTLVRMRQVVENEMLVHGVYTSATVERYDLAEEDSVCGGKRACAVGALWFGYGSYGRDGALLEGVSSRSHYFVGHPVLEAAYNALNTAAFDYIHEHDMNADQVEREGESIVGGSVEEQGWLEILFESGELGDHDQAEEKAAMMEIIENARKIAVPVR